MIEVASAFQRGTDWLRRLLIGVSVLVAMTLSASSGMAQPTCCPMLANGLACHADAIDACAVTCSLCQAQTPAAISLTLALLPLATGPALTVATPIHQLLLPPATPPPRG